MMCAQATASSRGLSPTSSSSAAAPPPCSFLINHRTTPSPHPTFPIRPLPVDMLLLWAALLALCALRVLTVLPSRIVRWKFFHQRVRPPPRVGTMVVWGSGGHTGEMCKLLPALTERAPTTRYSPLTFVLAASDELSRPKATSAASSAGLAPSSITWATLPRAREVGQAWLTTPWTAGLAAAAAVALMLNRSPRLLLCNGPGTCVPLAYAAFLLRFLGLGQCKVVYVESVCRTQGLSLTGRLLYPIADRFIVQWPQLVQRWPSAEYIGLLF